MTGTVYAIKPNSGTCYELPDGFEDLRDLDLVDVAHSDPIFEIQCHDETVTTPAPVSDSGQTITTTQQVCQQVQTGTNNWTEKKLQINATRMAVRKAAIKAAKDADDSEQSAIAALKAKMDAGTSPTAVELRQVLRWLVKQRLGK